MVRWSDDHRADIRSMRECRLPANIVLRVRSLRRTILRLLFDTGKRR